MKTFLIVMIVFAGAVVAGFFYVGMAEVDVKQVEKTVDVPLKPVEQPAAPAQ